MECLRFVGEFVVFLCAIPLGLLLMLCIGVAEVVGGMIRRVLQLVGLRP